MVILEPCAGLGNRLLAMASAHEVCRALNRELVIVWKREAGCNAKASDLFTFDGVRVDRDQRERLPQGFFWNNQGKYDKKYRNKGTVFFPCEKIDAYKQKGQFEELKELIAREPVCYIKSYTNLCALSKESFAFLKPSVAIEQKGRAVFDALNENTIGVHIRRTDHADAIKHSPLELFYERMEQEIAAHDANFYVTTDDAKVEDALRARFAPQRLVFYEGKLLDRDSRAGIEDALIDMLALSRCSKILGSYQSTFSLIPSIMGGIPLETMTLAE